MGAVLAIFGPTGSGKTEVAVHAARLLGTEVVNCDPAQCYEGLPILTNKPTAGHDAIAPHRLVGTWPLDREASVVEFAHEAHRAIDDLCTSTGFAIACGGSGLYLRAALCDLGWGSDPAAAGGGGAGPDAALRERIGREYDERGALAAHARLAALDPDASASIHPNDRKRVVRALEVALGGGSVAPGGSSLWNAPYRHGTTVVGLAVERAAAHAAIEARTAAMFERGVLEEVAVLVGERAERAEDVLSSTSSMLHGLADCVGALRGDHDVARARQLMATRTRQYVKRQDTWARGWPGLWRVPVELPSYDPAAVATLLVSEGDSHAVRQVAGTR